MHAVKSEGNKRLIKGCYTYYLISLRVASDKIFLKL